MDLSVFITSTGGVLQEAGDAAIISSWLSMEEVDAISAIRERVETSPEADVDRLDAALLTMTSTHFDPAARVQLAKFYAWFKIVELLRFEKFRGFPADVGEPFRTSGRN
jgi:hypothetical protein